MIPMFLRSDLNWDPFREWDSFAGYPSTRRAQAEAASVSPRYEVEEKEDGYLLWLDIPGVKKEDIQLETKGQRLTVSANRKAIKKGESSEVVYRASFEVPEIVTFDGAEASYQDGVLNVALPKVKEATARTIKITDGKGDFLGKLVQGFKKDETKKEATT